MYKCRLVYDEWKCMKSKEQKGKFIKTEDFVGYIGAVSYTHLDVYKRQDAA